MPSRPYMLPVPTGFICQVAPRLTGTLQGDKAHPVVFDNAKLKRFVPEFQCRTPFRAGIREAVSWLRAHPDQQRLDPQVDAEFENVIAAWRRVGH